MSEINKENSRDLKSSGRMALIRLAETVGGKTLYQLKITLAGSKPPIWRRIAVPATIRLDQLHHVIQSVMGWYDCHLHQYTVGHDVYGMPDSESEFEELNECHYSLQDIASESGQRFVYLYDFGDSWEHKIVVEKVLPPDSTFKHPLCLAGKNACPPEDCGGIYGFYDFVDAIKNPKHEEHESMKTWIGGDWDPAAFNLDRINSRLRTLKV